MIRLKYLYNTILIIKIKIHLYCSALLLIKVFLNLKALKFTLKIHLALRLIWHSFLDGNSLWSLCFGLLTTSLKSLSQSFCRLSLSVGRLQTASASLYVRSGWIILSPPQINIEGTSLNSVEHFTYLGSVISNDTTINKDLDNRLARASSAFGRLHERVWQNHSLCLSTKIQVYRAVVVSTLLYGCATWVLYRKQIRLLEQFHQRCLRSIMGIKWQEYVLKRASLPSLECTLLQQQLRWAGHVARMEDSRMPKAVFFGELREGKRKCGAPKKRYKDQLKKQLSLTEIPLHSWQQEANSRENWRKVVGSASRRFECSRRDAAEGKRKKRKERMTSQSAVSTYTQICPRCGRACASCIGLYSHKRACRTPPTHWSSMARNQPSS